MNLNKLQQQFSEALLYQNSLITTEIQEKEAFASSDLLQVYRNSFVMGVTEALSITYQQTSSLVGEEFFNAVARQFILQQPPHENNIMTYGGGLSEYLHTLEQLKNIPYIAEMARFEWLLEQTSNLPIQTKKLDVKSLATIAAEQLPDIIFQVPTQVNLFSSEQNIRYLYQMLIDNNVQETDLNQSCYIALKKQPDFTVEIINLTQEEFLLVQQISQQQCLAQVAPSDLHQFLPALMEKELLNGFTIKEDL